MKIGIVEISVHDISLHRLSFRRVPEIVRAYRWLKVDWLLVVVVLLVAPRYSAAPSHNKPLALNLAQVLEPTFFLIRGPEKVSSRECASLFRACMFS